MRAFFIATETFDPGWGEQWDSYISWSKIEHLEEVVTLDKQLCPFLPDIVNEEAIDNSNYFFDPLCFLDEHVINKDKEFRNPHLFTDVTALYSQAKHHNRKNILYIYKDPQSQPIAPSHNPPFEFLGYDLMDKLEGYSILLNSEGSTGAFESKELSAKGLVASHQRAMEIKTKLKALRKKENMDSDVIIWAIFRLQS